MELSQSQEAQGASGTQKDTAPIYVRIKGA